MDNVPTIVNYELSGRPQGFAPTVINIPQMDFPTITNYALRIMNSIMSDARIEGSPYLDAAMSPAFP